MFADWGWPFPPFTDRSVTNMFIYAFPIVLCPWLWYLNNCWQDIFTITFIFKKSQFQGKTCLLWKQSLVWHLIMYSHSSQRLSPLYSTPPPSPLLRVSGNYISTYLHNCLKLLKNSIASEFKFCIIKLYCLEYAARIGKHHNAVWKAVKKQTRIFGGHVR